MALGNDDDLMLVYDDGLEDTLESSSTIPVPNDDLSSALPVSTIPASSPGFGSAGADTDAAVSAADISGNNEKGEKATRTKAYKLAAPVGALFGRLAKVGTTGGAASAS